MKITDRLRLYTRGGVVDEEILAAAEEHFGWCPPFYKAFVRAFEEAEFGWGEYGYLRIWRPMTCIDMDEAYFITKEFGPCFPLGDNGGSKYLAEFPDRGLLLLAYNDIDINDATYVGPSLEALLLHATGLELTN